MKEVSKRKNKEKYYVELQINESRGIREPGQLGFCCIVWKIYYQNEILTYIFVRAA